MDFETPIEQFTRISPAYKTRLKNMGILTMRDLLYHFPSRYQDFSSRTNIAAMEVDKTSCIQGTIEAIKIIRIWKRHMTLIEAMVADGTGTVKALWFNQPYLAGTLKKGTVVCLAGKLVDKKGGKYLSNPMYEKVRDSFETEEDYTHTGRLVPVYPETAGVSSRWLRYIIKPLLAGYSKMSDPLPETITGANEFMPWRDAIKQIHFPESEEFAAAARKRFAFEELFFIQQAVLRERVRLNNEKAFSIKFDADLVKEFVKS